MSVYLNPTFIFDTNFCLNVVLTKIVDNNNYYILIRPGIYLSNYLNKFYFFNIILLKDGHIDGLSSSLYDYLEMNLH